MSEFRGGNNAFLTQGLFVEWGDKDAPYTLKEVDITKNDKLYKSIHKMYMQSVDEYDAAMKIVGSMAHWRKLCELKWFMEGFDKFSWVGLATLREDMSMRDRSLAKEQLQVAAAGGNATAMKLLYETNGTLPKKSGRPTKSTQDTTKDDEGIIELFKQARGS